MSIFDRREAAVLLVLLLISPFLWWRAMLLGMRLMCPMWQLDENKRLPVLRPWTTCRKSSSRLFARLTSSRFMSATGTPRHALRTDTDAATAARSGRMRSAWLRLRSRPLAHRTARLLSHPGRDLP